MTGNAANADPVCDKSPHHGLVLGAIESARRTAAGSSPETPLYFRDDANSRLLAGIHKTPPA
jgi:pyrroloquinoline quinone biosynthesis protein E